MKPSFPISVLLGILLIAGCETKISTDETTTRESPEGRTFFQLKVYSFASEAQIEVVDDYLEGAYIPALKRAGLQDIGVFKTKKNSPETENLTYVLVPFKSPFPHMCRKSLRCSILLG